MDKFNDIWKNRFNEGDTPLGDWNTPDDAVWDNILPHVPVKKDNRRKWWLLSLLILAGLVLIYFSLVKTGANKTTTFKDPKTVVNTSNVLANLQEKTPLTSKATSENSLGNKILDTDERLNKKVKPILKDNKLSVVEIKKYKSPTTTTKTLPTENADKLIVATENPLVTPSSDEPLEEEIQIEEQLDDLSILPLRNMMLQYEPAILALPAEVKVNLEKSPKPILNLKTSVGAVLWQHKISEQYTSDLAPFDFNYSDDMGWAVNLEIQLPVNKYLDVSGGLQYEQIETSSGHNSALTYKVAVEQEETTNDYNLDLATPYGLSQASFRFDRVENVSDGTIDLLVDFHSQHTIRNLSIPVGVKIFPLGKQKRFVP